jgi:integrase
MTTRGLRPDEIALLEQTLARRGRHRDRLFLLLAVTTGFRVSELLTLQFSQLTTVAGQVADEITISRRLLKGGRGGRARSIRSRRIPLSERARGAISDFLVSLHVHPTGESYVFSSRKGDNRPITRCHAHYLLKTMARELSLDADRIGCHSCRRTFARGVYIASGHDLVKTQRLLGHASPLTTARYLAPDEVELDDLARGFDPLAPLFTSPAAAGSRSSCTGVV